MSHTRCTYCGTFTPINKLYSYCTKHNNHRLCNICREAAYENMHDITPEPPFPYCDDVLDEDRYWNETHIIWNLNGDYPELEKWEKECERIDELRQKRLSIRGLNRCPCCSNKSCLLKINKY